FSSHYDLLVSEARIASFIAIAKGDVPLEHWFALGRPMRTEPQGRQLLSWSGTMFEFLMPMLFTNSYENSQLDFACRNAVKAQAFPGGFRNPPTARSMRGRFTSTAPSVFPPRRKIPMSMTAWWFPPTPR